MSKILELNNVNEKRKEKYLKQNIVGYIGFSYLISSSILWFCFFILASFDSPICNFGTLLFPIFFGGLYLIEKSVNVNKYQRKLDKLFILSLNFSCICSSILILIFGNYFYGDLFLFTPNLIFIFISIIILELILIIIIQFEQKIRSKNDTETADEKSILPFAIAIFLIYILLILRSFSPKINSFSLIVYFYLLIAIILVLIVLNKIYQYFKYVANPTSKTNFLKFIIELIFFDTLFISISSTVNFIIWVWDIKFAILCLISLSFITFYTIYRVNIKNRN